MTEQKLGWSDYQYRDNPQYPPHQQYSPHGNSHSQQLFDYKMNKYQNYPLSPASSTDSNCVKNYDYAEHVTDNQNNIEENVNENNWRYQQFSPSSQSLPSPQAQDYGRLNSPINYSRCDYPQSVPNHLQRLSQSSPHFGYNSPGSPNSHLAQKQFRISTPTPLLTPGPSPVPSPLYSPQMFKPIVKRMPRGKNDNKPRGRMTAYAFFVQTCREEHKKKHPDENVVFAEFSKKCAERWKTMLDKEKRRFHEMAEKDKVRYDSEMQNYVPSKAEKRGKKRKHIKDPNAPKRSLSAFFWFCNDERPKVKAVNPEYGVGDVAKELGRRWADADPDTKSKYEAMAEKDKARYDREYTDYRLRAKTYESEDDSDGGSFNSYILWNYLNSIRENKPEENKENPMPHNSDASNNHADEDNLNNDNQIGEFMAMLRTLTDTVVRNSTKDDEHSLFAERIAIKLRNIKDQERRFVIEREIEKMIFQEEMRQTKIEYDNQKMMQLFRLDVPQNL